MRIIAGEWRGRRLQAPPGEATRPTADRVRETLFSMLASRLGKFEQLRVADLFAGSGAFGLEAYDLKYMQTMLKSYADHPVGPELQEIAGHIEDTDAPARLRLVVSNDNAVGRGGRINPNRGVI